MLVLSSQEYSARRTHNFFNFLSHSLLAATITQGIRILGQEFVTLLHWEFSLTSLKPKTAPLSSELTVVLSLSSDVVSLRMYD
jgi:hypothetical protein